MGNFVDRARSLEDELFDFLSDVMRGEGKGTGAKLGQQLAAAKEILGRSVPLLKAVEVRGTLPVTIHFTSASEGARRALRDQGGGEATATSEGNITLGRIEEETNAEEDE